VRSFLIVWIHLLLISSIFHQAMADRLAFVKNCDIYVADIDTEGDIRKIRNITNHPACDSDPSWSPDGKRIAFSSNRDGFFNLFIMGANGENPLPLSKEIDSLSFDWSSDGKRMIIEGELIGERGRKKLFIVDSYTGKILLEIPMFKFSPYSVASVKWSSDGKFMACLLLRKHKIGVIDTNTWKVKEVTKNGEIAGMFDLSKNGWIAFKSKDNKGFYLKVITPEGEEIRKYQLPGFTDLDTLSWSPGGDRIIFAGSQDKGKELLYLLDLRTGRIKSTGVEGGRPDWWGGYTAVELPNLFNTLWGLIKIKE